jgi:hypothetical protein
MEMSRAIEHYIDAKNDFYVFAKLSIPELVKESRKFEDGKPGADAFISSAATREQEQELLDTLDRQ